MFISKRKKRGLEINYKLKKIPRNNDSDVHSSVIQCKYY